MNVRIEHVALWVRDVERVAEFYARYFGARIGDRYENPRTGFQSRFLAFASGARLEVMARSDVGMRAASETVGFAHLAIAIGNEAAVDALATRLRVDGVSVLDGPRRTGDGYYECVVLDPEGNHVEVTAE
jgi:lactoylglutathione lyase